MTDFQILLRCCVVANQNLVLCVIAFLAFVHPVRAQGKDPWIFVPRDAKSIAAALAALPGRGTIIVTAEAKSDPGFVAADFRDLSIVVTPTVPITGSAIFTHCTNVAFYAGTIENNLQIDTCTNVRTGPSGFVPTPPSMLSIRQAAYVKDSTDVSLVGLSFTKGAFGIRISGCFDQSAKVLDGWRRGKTPESVITPNPPPGVRISGCEFLDLAPGAGTTVPVGVRGSASYVEVWNSKFGPYDGYGIEIFGGSLAGIGQCTFKQLEIAAIELYNAEGFVQRCSIDGVAGIPGDGVNVVMTPAKGNSRRASPRLVRRSASRIAPARERGWEAARAISTSTSPNANTAWSCISASRAA